jgi:hypothetical protein
MRSLLILAILANTADAAPETTAETISGTPGVAGATADEALNKVTRADDQCLPKCTTELVKQTTLPANGVLQLRLSTNAMFVGRFFRIAMKDGKGAWTAWNPKGDLVLDQDDCGMSKCTNETLESVVVERTKDVVWFHMRVRFDLTRDRRDGSGFTNHHDQVIACKTAPALSCAAVTTSAWDTSRSTIRGTTVTTRSELDGKPHIDIATLKL